MEEHLPFINAIADDPSEDTGWLVYADWLEERGENKSQFIRDLIRLCDDQLSRKDWNHIHTRLADLRGSMDSVWMKGMIPLWAARPLAIHIDQVIRLGNIPPQQMFDRAMSILNGILVSGTIRVGDQVLIPLENGSIAQERVVALETFTQTHYEFSAGKDTTIGLAFSGHQVANLGVLLGGLLRKVEISSTSESVRR